MTKFVLMTLLLLSALISVNAQLWSQGRGSSDRPSRPVIQITGQVRYGNGQAGPQGIMVTLDSQRGGMAAQTQTDSRGKFVFSGVPQDLYTVRARHPGYEEMSETADLREIPIAYLQLVLKPLASTPPGNDGKAALGPPVSLAETSLPPGAKQEFESGRKLLFDEKKPRESVSHFQKAIKSYPSYAAAYASLGVAKLDLKEWKDAESALMKAIELDNKLASAYLALGACRNEQGRFAEAEQPLIKALELSPDVAQGEYELGRAYWALKRVDEAEPHARKAVALHADFPLAHLLMGNILLRRRDAAAALQEFKEYLRLEPEGTFAPPTREMVGKIERALAGQR